jgi:two-component system cell cycle response regulator
MMEELRLREEICGRLGSSDGSSSSEEVVPARILLIEEQGFAASRIVDTLSPITQSIVRAGNCAEAQAALDEHIELIIASLSMPDGDPLRLVAQWRANEHYRQLPILLMAEEAELSRLAKGLDLGANDYLIRPVERNELLARARTQIRRKRLQERLREDHRRSLSLALTDELTGLYNRRYMLAHLNELLARAGKGDMQTAVLMLDIDHFKSVNDNYGHPAGDDILRELVARLLRQVRSVDLVARLGGEEFVAVMPETSLSGATTVAERLRVAVAAEPFTIKASGEALPVTISIGVAASDEVDEDVEMLLKRADDALYAAKNGGRNRVASISAREASFAAMPMAS